jgi:hypothetical protein
MGQIQRLPDLLAKNDLPYNLIKRNEHVAMYGVGGTYYPNDLHYEVVRIIHVQPKVLFGKVQPEHEALPSNERFGKEGSRAITERKRAETYFQELTQKLKSKNGAPKDCSLKKNSFSEGVDTTLVVKSGAENKESNRISGS